MTKQLLQAATLLSCSLVGFCCGTLYLYSAYSPQLAHQLSYTGTESQFIAFCGLIGVSLSGIPSGLLIDRKGFTLALVIGSVCISSGYIGLKHQFDTSYSNLNLSSAFLFIVGCGSTFINSTLIKCCAITFPNNRGIATSFPIATYGLSAFAYSFFGSLLFKSDTSKFIGFLGYSTLVLSLIGLPCIYIADVNSNKGHTVRVPSRPSLETRPSGLMSQSIELQTFPSPSIPLKPLHLVNDSINKTHSAPVSPAVVDSDSSPLEILKNVNFWLVLITLGILAALGQMYIYSVGYITKSLLTIRNASDDLITSEQKSQVSALSIANFSGRLLSGLIGDTISNTFKASRSWNLLIPTTLILLVQIIGYTLKDYSSLWIESIINGMGYGFTWSSIPQLLIEYFGVGSFSFAWGVVNLGPIIPGYYFTHLFGSIYDSNLTVDEVTQTKVCIIGGDCYNGTFKITIFFAFITVIIALWINFSPLLHSYRRLRS